MSLTAAAAARTDIGRVRKRNEDAMYSGRWLFAVADGLGGHVAGDTASTLAIGALQACDRQIEPAELTRVLGQAVKAANDSIRKRIDAESELAGMGTTLVAMMLSGTTAALANVGDSRAYLLRGKSTNERRSAQLTQITEDHTYGHLIAEAAAKPGMSERITRFLDGRADGRSPDISIRTVHHGDRFLLCSDGLSSVVPHELMQGVLKEVDDPAMATDRLIALAIDHGGPDNITAIVIDIAQVR